MGERMLRYLRAIFIVLFISSLDSARAEWINYDELAELKIKYELSSITNHSKIFEKDKKLYDSIIQKISSKIDIDEQLDGFWTLAYMCVTDHIANTTTPDIYCQRMTGPEISVIFYGKNTWKEAMQKTAQEGVYTRVNFKTFDIEVGNYSEQGNLVVDYPLSVLSFRIQGTIKAMHGMLESQVEGSCEKIKDPESVVCLGNSKLKPNKSYINIFERPDDY